MKVFFALVLGVIIGVAAFWFYSTNQGKSAVHRTGEQIENATKSTRDTIHDKLKVLDLRSDDIKDELARSGQVVRRKAKEAGQAIADATADARITGAIKAKLLADRELSALSISVNTTEGIVTLSGTVSSPDNVGKAMLLAMETDGVREVISTLQVKPLAKK
jgi:hyperosmotically inducible protein